MGRAKEIKLKVIPSKIANTFMKKHHYSGKVVQNSQLHFGAFLDGVLHGVMSFGPSLDKRKIQGLVKDTKWNEFLELNRLAFDDYLPKNSESRCISLSIKLLKKHASHIKWIISFADGTQCGDGTIYRASNFILTGIRKNNQIIKMPNGDIKTRFSLTCLTRPQAWNEAKKYSVDLKGKSSIVGFVKAGCEILDGYQLRYIYFIDKSYKKKLTIPELPYSKIYEMGAGMYKGEKLTKRPDGVNSNTSNVQLEAGGSIPTSGL